MDIKINYVYISALYLVLATRFISAETSINTNISSSTYIQEESCSQLVNGYLYDRPGLFTFIKNGPGDLKQWWKNTFRKENTLAITAMVLGTGLLVAIDQEIVDEARRFGEKHQLSQEANQKTVGKISFPYTSKGWKLAFPHNTGTAMYFLGDGWTHLMMSGGFLTYGLTAKDNRALQTASQIFESILAAGFVVQVLKHTTGRESPFTATVPGGKWRFFPSQSDYLDHTAEYDAFPSGHVATAMATLTVISENYSEYRYIRPIGYTLLGLLSYQMLNNGVHWVSDYPLSIALGYSFGHIAVKRGRTEVQKDDRANNFTIEPAMFGNSFGIVISKKFSL